MALSLAQCFHSFFLFLQANAKKKESEDSLTRQLDNVYRCFKYQLKRCGSDTIGYYNFCLHPTDFARTIENIFYISFLVKEAKVKIIRHDGQLPQIGLFAQFLRKNFHF